MSDSLGSGYVEMVRLLLDAGADLSGSIYDAVLITVMNGNPDVVELLRQDGSAERGQCL